MFKHTTTIIKPASLPWHSEVAEIAEGYRWVDRPIKVVATEVGTSTDNTKREVTRTFDNQTDLDAFLYILNDQTDPFYTWFTKYYKDNNVTVTTALVEI